MTICSSLSWSLSFSFWMWARMDPSRSRPAPGCFPALFPGQTDPDLYWDRDSPVRNSCSLRSRLWGRALTLRHASEPWTLAQLTLLAAGGEALVLPAKPSWPSGASPHALHTPLDTTGSVSLHKSPPGPTLLSSGTTKHRETGSQASWVTPTGHRPLVFLEHQQAGEEKLTALRCY